MKEAIKLTVLAFFAALIIVTLVSGCARHSGLSTTERTGDDGKTSVEIQSKRTFDKKDLPAGVKKEDVVSVIPITIEIPDPAKDAGAKSVNKKVSGNLYALKDGNVVADKSVAKAVGQTQTVKRSWAWLWWIIGAIAALLALAWSVDKFIKPIELVGKLLGRK